MKTELFISWRYLVTRRKERFISLISVISVLGVAIGVTALIVVIAVMSGFDRELRDKIVGNYSHITIAGYRGISQTQYEAIALKIMSHPRVKGVSPYVQGQVLLKQAGRLLAVSIRGIDPRKEASVTKIGDYLTQGAITDLKAGTVIVGRELAAYLDLGVGSELNAYSAQGKEQVLKVAGIFSSGMYDYDMNLIFTDITTAQETLGVPAQISAIAVKLDNMYLAEKVKEELGLLIGYDYSFKTWMEANRNFFSALELEKLTMFIILTLIILVAAFNIASTLIVMVVEKTRDIGILRAIGMTAKGVRRIFICEGLAIGGLGIFAGTAGGALLCWLLKRYQFIKLPQDIYYIEKLPVQMELWPDIALIVLAAMGITLASTVYPALKAARLKPAEALRYE